MTSPRNRHLSIRFTQKERERIYQAAVSENRSAADWARLILLEHCPELPSVQDDVPVGEAA